MLSKAPVLLVVSCLLSVGEAAAAPSRFNELGLPAAVSKTRLRGLLQRFVDRGFNTSFRHLGDERDFDHGHLLLAGKTKEPLAILYHTQEMAHAPPSADFGYVDPQARNWIQWFGDEQIENAGRYQRVQYPHTASWDWFRYKDLPELSRRRTITEKMLDPDLLGAEVTESLQWTFTRVDCGKSSPEEDSNVIDLVLPDSTPVCLALGS